MAGGVGWGRCSWSAIYSSSQVVTAIASATCKLPEGKMSFHPHCPTEDLATEMCVNTGETPNTIVYNRGSTSWPSVGHVTKNQLN